MSAYSDKIAAGSADAMLGPNPIVGFRGRDVALGKRALVDNSAGLVRMARKEPQFTDLNGLV